MALEKVKRAPIEAVKFGHLYNTQEIEEIITENKWPNVTCKACGGEHIAAIQKARDSQQGGEFEFVPPECPQHPAEKQGD